MFLKRWRILNDTYTEADIHGLAFIYKKMNMWSRTNTYGTRIISPIVLDI